MVVVTQLVQQAPLLLAYMTAIVLAAIYWQRCPTPAMLTLAAAGLLLFVSIGQTVATYLVIQARNGLAGRADQVGSILSAMGFGGSILRTIAFGLLVTAVFHGRSRLPTGLDE